MSNSPNGFQLGGRVQSITTQSGGDVTVIIDSTATGGIPEPGTNGPLDNYFYYPGNFNETILSEFKRAQDSSLGLYVSCDNSRTVLSVTLV